MGWPALWNLLRVLVHDAESSPKQEERPDRGRDRDAQLAELRGRLRSFRRNVHEHRSEQENQQKDDERTE